MATALIKLTPELIREGASKLMNAKNNNESAIDKLNGIIDGLVSDWHGEAQDAFAASYARKKATFQSFSVDLEHLIEALKKFADAMESMEKEKAGIAANLK